LAGSWPYHAAPTYELPEGWRFVSVECCLETRVMRV
jgi:hypothetical protein